DRPCAGHVTFSPLVRRARIVLATLRMRIDELARQFPEPVRRRGEACQRADAVTVTYATARAIRAVALGTEEYDVRIAVDDGTLALSCSCPAFERDGPCKHLCATALVAD